MTDRPILFSGPMVRALLREAEAPGTGKTQTRRVLTPRNTAFVSRYGVRWPNWVAETAFDWTNSTIDAGKAPSGRFMPCLRLPWDHLGSRLIAWVYPQVQVGDRLWVRETHITGWPCDGDDLMQFDEDGNELPRTTWYRADGNLHRWLGDNDDFGNVPWRPSIHMPRGASRLTLIVTDVRVQRLQDVTEEDALAEGVEIQPSGAFLDYRYGPGNEVETAVDSLRTLWESLNAQRGHGWDANDWVVALTFTVHQRNIDAMEKAA